MAWSKASERFKRMVDNIENVTINAFKKNTERMEDLNRLQMMDGVMRNGQVIQPEYTTASYARKKQRMYPSSKRALFTPNLRLSGTFQDKMVVSVNSAYITFGSPVFYTIYIESRYPKQIWGLTSESKEILKPFIVKDAVFNLKRL